MRQTKRVQRGRMKTVSLGHGVFAAFKDGKPQRLDLRQVPKLRAMLGNSGEALLIGFVQAFNAAERLDALFHIFALNSDHTKRGSIARQRNLRLIAVLQYAQLYEALEAIRTISGAGIGAIVGKTFAPWRKLVEMLGRWEKAPLLKLVRNKLGFHVGDRDIIRAGLSRVAAGKTITVFDTEGDSRFDSSFPLALEVLLLGAGVEAEAFNNFMDLANIDCFAFGRRVQATFCEALRVLGVRIPPHVADVDG
jgi:hypothetical protein